MRKSARTWRIGRKCSNPRIAFFQNWAWSLKSQSEFSTISDISHINQKLSIHRPWDRDRRAREALVLGAPVEPSRIGNNALKCARKFESSA
jgi:hypothetical protein